MDMLFAQGVILIKNHPETHLIINSDYSNKHSGDLKLSFEKIDTLVLEIQTDTYASRKKITPTGSRGYEIIHTSEGKYRLRLRSNIQLEYPTALVLDTIKPSQVISTPLMDKLEKQEFEFDKVNILISHLRKTGESNQNLANYLFTLEHDFSKWQVLEAVTSEDLLQLDYTLISQTLDSGLYKEGLKTLLESK